MAAVDRIFSNSTQIIAEILNRILNCMQKKRLYVYGDMGESLNGLYQRIDIVRIICLEDSSEGVFYIKCKDTGELKNVIPWIQEHRGTSEILLHVESGMEAAEAAAMGLGTACRLEDFSKTAGSVFLIGKTFDESNVICHVPADFKILAIVHVYNEADIMEALVFYLLGQGVDVYIVDNWSEDGTYEIAQKLRERFPERIFVERFPENGRTQYYEWYQQLERTEELGRCLQYDWFIHYDADEMRISPWKNATLRQTVYYADLLGYNLIENTVIDFKLTEDTNESIFMKDTYFDFGHRNSHFKQTKSWKKMDFITLKESGGHVAVVPEPKIFPLKILIRHYPFRNLKQAEKKVFTDRKPRFVKERGKRGWHGQYDAMKDKTDLLTDPDKLLKWDEETEERYYVPLFLGCGIAVEMLNGSNWSVPQKLINKRIVLYGAGNIGKAVYPVFAESCEMVGWVDKKYKVIPDMYCESVVAPEKTVQMDFDYLVIAVEDEGIKEEIRNQLHGLGIDDEKIV